MLTDLKELFKHYLSFGIGEILFSSLGIILIPIYTRQLSPEEYGSLSLLLISLTILSTISSIGLFTALLRSYFDYDNIKDRKKLIGTVFIILLCSSLTFSILFFFLISPLNTFLFTSQNYLLSLFYLPIINLSQTFTSFFLAIMRAQKKSLKYSIFNIIGFILRILCIIYYVVYLDKGVTGVITGWMIASIINFIFLAFASRKDIIFQLIPSEVKKLLKFGWPLVFINITGVLMNSLDRLVIKYFFDLSEVGLYNLGAQFGSAIKIFLVIPFGLIWPTMILAVKEKKYAPQFYSKVLTYFIYIGLLLSLAIGLFSSELISLIGTPQYQGAGIIIFPICLSYVFIGISNVLHVGITLQRKTELSIYIVTSTVIINFILNIVLIPHWRIMGAAFATTLSTIFMILIKWIIVRKLYSIPYEWYRISKIFIILIILYSVGNIIYFNNILSKCIIILSFPICLFFVNFYHKIEIKNLVKYGNIFNYKRNIKNL